MLRIRLRRVGAKKQPSYRIVVADSTAPRDGKFVEVIGFYNPRTEPETVTIKEARALHWLSVGAQPSNPVLRLFKNQGTLERYELLKAGESLEYLIAASEDQESQAQDTLQVARAPEAVSAEVVETEVETVESTDDERSDDEVDETDE
jgi:small subunit ribosomal protein S16